MYPSPLLFRLKNNLSELSNSLLSVLTTENLKTTNYQNITNQFLKLSKPVVDVEFAALKSFKKLIVYFSKKKE